MATVKDDNEEDKISTEGTKAAEITSAKEIPNPVCGGSPIINATGKVISL